MSSNTTFTYTAEAGKPQSDVDASMLLRFIHDTSSVQDRLFQGAAAQDAQPNDGQISDINPKEPRAKL
ncbi:hypothetical protein MRS44_010551 [Fusarium solani]|uniref:uncharacterized protein n=1 Tax=Fusarium solani TaxID=169388 RepID=UPI00232881B8|nr:hypothetical protein MRS44_010551 [Fusarium solani]KAJ4228092.1 hypothetical protein NW759_004179 [Fusarium solani]